MDHSDDQQFEYFSPEPVPEPVPEEIPAELPLEEIPEEIPEEPQPFTASPSDAWVDPEPVYERTYTPQPELYTVPKKRKKRSGGCVRPILAAALTLALFTGCGCAANVSTHPGGMITEETTRPAVMPMPTATHETTRPTEHRPTMPTGTEATGESSIPTETTVTTPTDTTRNRNAVR